MAKDSDTSPAEEWRDIPGYEGLYQVSDRGRVKALARSQTSAGGWVRFYRERIRAPQVQKTGYVLAVLHDGGKPTGFLVHRLVAQAFIGPCPDGMEVCHNNGVRADNRAANLRYDTRRANAADRKIHGTADTVRGESHGNAKLTEQQAREIIALKGAASAAKIGRRYGVGEGCVATIWRGINWAHLPRP